MDVHSSQTLPLPSIEEPTNKTLALGTNPDSTPSSTSSSDSEQPREGRSPLQRPKISSRKSSGTNIIPRDHPQVELEDEHFDADDARAMSPRRNSEDVEKLSQETRRSLQAYVSCEAEFSSHQLTRPSAATRKVCSRAWLRWRIESIASGKSTTSWRTRISSCRIISVVLPARCRGTICRRVREGSEDFDAIA